MPFLLFSLGFIGKFVGFLTPMDIALCFGSQAPNLFDLFCYYRNGGAHNVGVSKEGFTPIFWIFSFYKLLEERQILLEKTVGMGVSLFPFFVPLLSHAGLLRASEKTKLCMMCFFFFSCRCIRLRHR